MEKTLIFPVKPEFEKIYEDYYDRVYKYVFTMLLNREEAEDIVSETFILAYENYDRYDPAVSSPATWLSRIAHNRAVNMLKSAARRKRADMPSYYEAEDNSPDTAAESEDRELVLRLYAMLQAEEREFLNMRYAMGLSDSEVAELLGLNTKTVNKRYQRLLARCRRLLEEEGTDRRTENDRRQTGKSASRL